MLMKGGRLAIYFAPLYNGGGKKVAEITFNNATNYNPVTVVVVKVKGYLVGKIKRIYTF